MLTKGDLVKMGLREQYKRWGEVLPQEMVVPYADYLEYIIAKLVQDPKLVEKLRNTIISLPDMEF